jgi:NitT/TauT family transport system permease protein
MAVVEAPPRSAFALSRRARGRAVAIGGSVALFVVLMLAWQYGLRALNIPAYLVPVPTKVLERLISGFNGGTFMMHTTITLQEIVVGWVVGAALGILLGILIAQYSFIDTVLYPYVVALNALPKVAVAPLLVVWFGQGFISKVIVTALVAFFPLLVNVTVGLKSSDPEQLELMRSLTASRWQTFRKVQILNALPNIFAGLEIAIVLAVVGAIVGEFVGSKEGIGYYIQLSIALVDPAGMFAMFVILAVISWMLNQLVRQVARRVVFWKRHNIIVESA